MLSLLSIFGGYSLRPVRSTLVFAGIAGQLTFAAPWSIVVGVIQHLGSAIPAIIQSMAPIATLAIVYLLALERPNAVRLSGVGIGLIGTLVILFARTGDMTSVDASTGWYLAALAAPAVLAMGNVFRTTHWPKGQNPLPLAAWSLLAAALGLALVVGALVATNIMPPFFEQLSSNWTLVAIQSIATGVGYGLFFRLQQVGGPVYVSQMSYVNTAVGVGFAVLLFGESLSVYIWLALALIVAGVLLVNSTRSSS